MLADHTKFPLSNGMKLHIFFTLNRKIQVTKLTSTLDLFSTIAKSSHGDDFELHRM